MPVKFWNDDGDNKWGEPDEDDLLPDVSVARFPVSNTTELENMIHKSISYHQESEHEILLLF